MRISKVKGNGNYKMHLNEKELNALTIAIANLSIPDMEDEAKEQGLNIKEISYAHLEIFEQLTAITGLYPQKALKAELESDIKDFIESPPVGEEVL